MSDEITELAKALHGALMKDSPTAHVDPWDVDDRVVIDGRFDLRNVAKLLLKRGPGVTGRTASRRRGAMMTEEEYLAGLAQLRDEWGSLSPDPASPGVLRAAMDPTTGLLVGVRAKLIAEIINRAVAAVPRKPQGTSTGLE